MNNILTIKMEISVNWHNPYKNGHYKEIDIFIQNNSKDDIVIESIGLVCNGKSYHVDKSLLVLSQLYTLLYQRLCITPAYTYLIYPNAINRNVL